MSTPSPGGSQRFDVTNRSILGIAVPMTLAYLSTPLLGLVDTAVIGRLGSAALIGGIALGSIVFDLVFTTFNFLRSGTTGLTAQALGTGDRIEQVCVLLRAVILALVAGVAIIVLQVPLIEGGLLFLGGTDEVQQAARSYLSVRIYSAPFALANYAILGWFIGMGRAGRGLVLQTFLNGLNIALSVLFVLGLGWGIKGVALATAASEIATALAGALMILGGLRRTPAQGLDWARVRDGAAFRRMIAVNGDIMVRSFTLLFAFAFFAARSAAQGDVVLAANAVLQRLIIVSAYFLDGFAAAAEQVAGRAVGARYRPAFDRAVRLTLVWGFALAGFAALVLLVAGPSLVDLVTTNEEVREVARVYLLWAVIVPLFGVLAYQMDGIFIGATWSRDMRNMMLLSLAVFLAAYFAMFPIFGNHGLWAAFLIFIGIRGASLGYMCRVRADQTFAGAA